MPAYAVATAVRKLSLSALTPLRRGGYNYRMTTTRPATNSDRIRLLHAALAAACDALKGESAESNRRLDEYPDTFSGFIADDGGDYANAALDQIRFCSNLLIHGYDNADDALLILDRIFDATHDELQNSTDEMMILANGFILGYADHSSPI
jgi:hypothetical protein